MVSFFMSQTGYKFVKSFFFQVETKKNSGSVLITDQLTITLNKLPVVDGLTYDS